MWNKLLAISKNPKADTDTKKRAEMLLRQYSTAGGRRIKDEIEFFLFRNKELL